jgi:uncharacterized membrane protein YqjE
MIQRIQSLFLLGSLIVLLTAAFTPIVTLEGDFISEREEGTVDRSIFVSVSGFQIETEIADLQEAYEPEMKDQLPAVFPLGLGILAVVILTGFIIINYTDRKRQMKLIIMSLVLHALLIIASIFYGYAVSKVVAVYNDFFNIEYLNWGLIAIVLSAILSLVGRVYIKKDEDLVRSVDRIR